MWPQILLMVGALVAILFFGFLFINDMVQIAVNGVILYLVGLRAYVELTKHKRVQEYIIGFAVALVVITLIGNLFPLWKLTTFVVVTFIAAQLMRFIVK